MLGKLYGRYAKQFKVAGLALSDVLILNIVSILALWMRYEFQWNSIPEVNLDRALAYSHPGYFCCFWNVYQPLEVCRHL